MAAGTADLGKAGGQVITVLVQTAKTGASFLAPQNRNPERLMTDQLDDVVESVLAVVVNTRGASNADTVVEALDMTRARAQYYLDKLKATKYIARTKGHAYAYGSTAKGRAYIVERDLDE